ncbi:MULTISPECIES: hypothetical protein [Nocardia]|nr:hypothetical protein [Nocardia abscessus]
MADADGPHTDQDFVGSWIIDVDLFDAERVGRPSGQCGLDFHGSLDGE